MSTRVIDRTAFEKLRRIAPAYLSARREGTPTTTRSLPEEVSFKLTNRCNLRCAHCYEWNEDGYHHDLPLAEQRGELDLAIIEKVLESTRELGSNVYLWGGEPLVYRQWDGLIDLLVAHRRWTSICTNGTLIARRLDSLLRLGERIELVIALDGFEAEHDALRGKGMFARTLEAVRQLVREKASSRFLGEITVNCVMQDAMVGRLYDFVRAMDEVGIDTLYLSYPWFISPESAAKMDSYVGEHFPLRTLRSGLPSWHSYTFSLSPTQIDALRQDLRRVDDSSWKLKLRYNPEIGDADLRDFLAGSDRPAGGRTRCHALRSRLDVLPSGEAVSCKFFPEFTVGSLHSSEVTELWHGPRFEQVRTTVDRCGLMPVCAKCPLLYTRGQ